MRWLLLGLLLVPSASGLTVDLAAPERVPLEPTPVAIDAEIADAEEPVELKAWLGGADWQASRTWNGEAFQRSDHYARTVDPGEDGRWRGRLWVQANPDSSNAGGLHGGELAVGVRARSGDQRAEALAAAQPFGERSTSWATAGPGRSIEVRGDGSRLAVLGSPGERAPIRVPRPGADVRVCGPEACQGSFPWRLHRVGEERIQLSETRERGGDAGGVLVREGEACALPQAPPNSSRRWTVEVSRLEASGACRAAGEDPWAARLLALGREVSRAPERPGRGEVVRDPVEGGWAPWRLPAGSRPTPAESMRVEGRATVVDTEKAGLRVLEDVLARAEHRVTASTYLFTNERVAELLAHRASRGVDVHLWLEPDPVGGLPEQTERLREWLGTRGVQVHEAEGPTNGGLQHAKTVVVDSGLVLVLTENFTDHGLPGPGEGNEGLALGVANASLARAVESLFREPGPSREIRPQGWAPLEAPVTVVTAPENAWRTSLVPAWIEEGQGPVQGAVLRANPSWGSRANPWLEAMVNHSRQAPVEVLLSGVPDGAARSNREAIAHLSAHPRAGDLEARLSDPREGTLHAKVIATSKAALVGSSNWGLGGVLLNREVNLLVHDARLAGEVSAIVEAWREPTPSSDPLSKARELPFPGGLGLWVGLAAAVPGVLSRRREPRPARSRSR